MTDDATLLRRYANERANDAFTELVGRHLDFVFSAAMREVGGDFARAQDITQTVFTVLAQKASALHQRDTLVGWLHVSVHHAAAELKRREQRRQKREQEAFTMLELSSPSIAEENWERLKPVLNSIVEELGSVERDAVLLRFYQKRSLGEIGSILRLSEDAVQKRVSRALEKMRAGLVKRGITSTSMALAAMLQNNAVVAAPASLLASITQGALTAASTVGGAAALFLGMGKIPLGLAAALAIAGGATIVLQSHPGTTSSAEDSGLEQQNQRFAFAHPESSQTKSELPARSFPKTETEQLGSESVVHEVVSPTPVAALPNARSIPSGQMKQWLAAANDPKVLARLATEARGLTWKRYSYLIERLELSAEQSEALLRQLDHKRLVNLDVAVVDLQRGLDPRDDPSGFQSRIAVEKTALEKKIRSLLGDERYLQYQAYNRQLNQETASVRLEEFIGGTEDALSPDQRAKLQQLLQVHGAATPQMMAEAQSFLSPTQVEALQEALQVKEAVRNRPPQDLPSSP